MSRRIILAGWVSFFALMGMVTGCGVTSAGAEGTQEEVKLYHDEVEVKNPGGKDLVMQFSELKRDKNCSEVIVVRKSGASVPSSMFIAKGMYAIAKIRGVKYFVNLKEWDEVGTGRHYLVGFSDDKERDAKVQFPNQYDATKDLGFSSVADFSVIFEEK